MKGLMKLYMQALLKAGYFNKSVNYETSELEKSVKNTYKEFRISDFKT